MNSNRTPTPPPDLKVTLRGLSSSIENAMIAWYNIQTAPLWASSSQPTLRARSFLPTFRNSLHLHWTGIVGYLQKCHSFSEDVITWDKSFGEDPESISWLEDLTSYSDEIILKNEDLVRQSDQGIECLSSLTPQLSELLKGPSKSTAAFPATYSFPGMSSSPDRLTAIASTSAALAEIHTSLRVLSQFWIAVSQTCRSLQKSNENITMDGVRNLGDTWKEYQQEILAAKVSISKSLDAVAIEPSACRRQQRRRGSSKSEMSISSSPRLLSPRRMSNSDGLDDDQLPKSCWGFAGFLGRKR
ncbi:hypothetical protein B0H12DRAFT_1131973 [Mycena haematopus]|nr:hypothetical protein B0H12DRAFT_1131973 [Mycena haematopus]